MTQIHQSRSSPSPYVDRVWRTQNTADGVYLATPDGSWDLILGVDQDGTRTMLLAGQATEPAQVPYKANTSSVVIAFAAGAYLANMPSKALLNLTMPLPIINNHFRLDGHDFDLPTYDNAETLVEQMVQAGVLKNDEMVEAALRGAPKAASKRAVQRHFKDAAGLPQKALQQIHQAQRAVRLLQKGKSPVDAAVDAGYADQSHLAKSLKRIMHKKPSDVDDIHKL